MALGASTQTSVRAGHGDSHDASILIGFADALAAPETAWSLLDSGASVTAFARHGSQPALRHARRMRLVYVTPPEQDLKRTVEDLRKLLGSAAFTAVMPLDDAAIWLCNEAEASAPTPITVGPTGLRSELALDKQRQCVAAVAAGFAVPDTQVITTINELMSIPRLPVVVKPARPIGERNGVLVRPANYVCADRAELAAAAEAWNEEQAMLVQPLIKGAGEGLFGLVVRDQLYAVSAHRRLRMMNPQGSGSSACVAVPPNAELTRAAERMLTAAEWRGMFMLEFLRDDAGTSWFMELNGRPWGSMALARCAGLEYPAWAMRAEFDDTFEPPNPDFRGEIVCRHLGRDLVHLIMVMRGPQSAGLTDWPSRLDTLRAVLSIRRREHLYNWRPGERRVFWDDTVRTVVDQIRSVRL